MKDIDTFTANEPQVLLKCTFPNWSIEYTTEHQLNERFALPIQAVLEGDTTPEVEY